MNANTPATRAPAAPRAQHRRGPILWMIDVVAALIGRIALSFLVATLIEWVGIHTFWADQGLAHSRDMVYEDIGYLSDYRQSLLTDDSVGFATSWARGAAVPFESLGLVRFTQAELAHAPAPDDPGMRPLQRALRTVPAQLALHIAAAIYVAEDIAVRLSVAVLALPAFGLALLLGVMDGLAKRDVRKWAGGRESSFVYHRAKHLIWPCLTGGIAFYLAWPIGGFNPAWMVLPACMAVAGVTSVMAAMFKKYV